jgi:hypothetical protein
MNPQILNAMRELHSRVNDGIHVRLLWAEHDDRVVVAVDDATTGDRFGIEVKSHERALDVFHHPFAYASSRGIQLGSEAPIPAASFA